MTVVIIFNENTYFNIILYVFCDNAVEKMWKVRDGTLSDVRLYKIIIINCHSRLISHLLNTICARLTVNDCIRVKFVEFISAKRILIDIKLFIIRFCALFWKLNLTSVLFNVIWIVVLILSYSDNVHILPRYFFMYINICSDIPLKLTTRSIYLHVRKIHVYCQTVSTELFTSLMEKRQDNYSDTRFNLYIMVEKSNFLTIKTIIILI